MIEVADFDRDGRISREEFYLFMTGRREDSAWVMFFLIIFDDEFDKYYVQSINY